MMQDSQKLQYRAGWLSIIGNILLFFVKYWAGITSASIALIADAWHTLSDSISSVVVLLGIKVSNKERNEKRPYGYGRAELIASLIVGILLFIVSIEFFRDSIDKLYHREDAKYGIVAIIITIISILAKELMARYSFYIGKISNSKALHADGWHHRSDAFSSILILIGIFFGKYFWWIDGVLGLIVSVLIAYTAFEILKESISPLIGEDADDKFVEEINKTAFECFGRDMKIHHIHTHTYGDHIELTLHMVFPKETTLEKAHDDATLLEHKIFEKFDIHSTIHMEPEGHDGDIE